MAHKSHSIKTYRSETNGYKASHRETAQSWANEFRTHVTIPESTIDDYLAQYVPSLTSFSGRPKSTFKNVPLGTVEQAMYKPLCSSFSKLVSKWPENIRLEFHNITNTTILPLGFSEHPTRPNIAICFPAESLPRNTLTWEDILVSTEVKRSRSQDPIAGDGTVKRGVNHDRDTMQLSKNARNLLAANMACFVFVLGIYGDIARIYRFSRRAIVVSEPFNYIANPKIFAKFFWRLVHPTHQPESTDSIITKRIVGSDNTIFRTSDEDKTRMAKFLCQYHQYTAENAAAEVENSRWYIGSYDPPLNDIKDIIRPTDNIGKGKGKEKEAVLGQGSSKGGARVLEPNREEMEDDTDSSQALLNSRRKRFFTFGKPLYQSFGLFSRATSVRRAVIEGHEENLFALKDFWPERSRKPEAAFYKRIKKNLVIEGKKSFGLAECLGGLDLGAVEEPELGHCTLSGSLVPNELLERTHSRLIIEPVGYDIEAFSSTKSLIEAWRDAIIGHHNAHAGGVLHRDISPGNVMFAKSCPFVGFVQDLDYGELLLRESEKEIEAEVERSLKDLTGTFQFIAIEILDSNDDVKHEVKHDLESFFWLLIWCILRHTTHSDPRGSAACSTLFDHDNKYLAAAVKFRFLSTTKSLVIDKNVPLTKLLQTLTRFILLQQHDLRNPVRAAVTHEMFLDAIDKHLEMDGWPEDDAALIFIAPSSSSIAQGTAHASGSQQLPGSSSYKRKRHSAAKRKHQDTSSSEEAVAAEVPDDRTSRRSGLRKDPKRIQRV
ncbi:hypothetical protein PILCRDRAFT_830179 [Piloderma croceum F 1598]|uniref:Protein kinase domain-containing protein n=1 Tax=Piloderma croceum (strain F 1598) TaxID=765440 RepID=A0A0C3EV68_PILCF|nr:hypothetical protein PILCRDRAFT_830179 [Piloderma croceum F 1598]